MLLAIDEIVNITQDKTVVIHGMVANVDDLPEQLRQGSPMDVFSRFFQPSTFNILAPMVQADTAPASFTKAVQLFPDCGRGMGLWPDDQPDLPARKQSLVQAPNAQPAPAMPQASWIFVVDADGGVLMTAVQLLAYSELGGAGQGLPVGKDRSLIGAGMPMGFPPPGGQPPKARHALRMSSWKLAPGKFDYRTWFDFNRPGPSITPPAPEAWGEAATQTILLATESPIRNVHWTRNRGRLDMDGFFPSSPILHATFLVGNAITIKKSWERTFEAKLVDQVPTALPAWYSAQLMMMRIVTSKVLGELGPLGDISDIFFDEMGKALDKNAAYVTPPWLGR
ncbi:MAG: hypothetical protein J7521_11190 [Caulobacter sp.]|nr:hypothetical protein [Caulobacter sp.]